MSHRVEIDLSSRSTPALIAKLHVAIKNGEKEMEDACAAELDRRKEHPEGQLSEVDD